VGGGKDRLRRRPLTRTEQLISDVESELRPNTLRVERTQHPRRGAKVGPDDRPPGTRAEEVAQHLVGARVTKRRLDGFAPVRLARQPKNKIDPALLKAECC